MSRRGIGIVDYGVGNHTSVWRTLYALGYRCKVTRNPAELDAMDLLVLPGVGAFPAAMQAMHARGLADYVRRAAAAGRPLLGICLGMQLLADSSIEYGETAGLGLIPGRVDAIGPGTSHIGWNTIEAAATDPMLGRSAGESFYFNHTYAVACPPEFAVAHATLGRRFPVITRRGRIVGVQFHPEKSQHAGRQLLGDIIGGLLDA
ncbi:MAG: imidazole glycerol phosphate synthase subunit HisH [Opitutae bacterium]|nr:imidazole glycerol phosphate synthase subunit HisH [Opitutae bacterium]